MEPVSINSINKGFTLNMAHYVKQVRSIKDGFIINGDSHLRIDVDSTYELGYFFGASISRAVINLSNYRGQVFFRMYNHEDSTKLYESVEEAFNIAPRFRQLNETRYEMVVYSKPIATLVSEFGVGADREFPAKYLVNNKRYLKGIKEGIEDFQGNIPDDREVLKRREFSPYVERLYNTLSMPH